MKKSVFLFFFLFPSFVYAQFPAPQDFQITINYILLGESDWCDNHLIQGPGYCYLFSWEAPDTAGSTATLTGYRVYKNGLSFIQTSETHADTAGAYFASFYVTAVYENPAGESDSSNMVVINSLPIPTSIPAENPGIRIGYDPTRNSLVIEGASPSCDVQLFDMLGRQLRYQKPIMPVQFLDGLRAGVYWVLVQEHNKVASGKLIWVGE